MKSIKTRHVNGFSLTHGHTGAEWSCDHRQLGERLGYASESNYKHILALVDRLSQKDPGFQALGLVSETSDTKPTGRGGTRTEFRTMHFTRKQALYIIAKSNKPEAATLTLAMVDAFDLILSGEAPSRADFIPFLLREDFCEWDLMWSPKVIAALCKMYGHKYDEGGTVPAWLRSPMQKIYKLVWGAEVYAAVKAENDKPRHGSNHHQALVDKARERFRAQLPFIQHTAQDAHSPAEFWMRLENVYLGYSMQLRLTGVDHQVRA